jgi:hypothetical protein
MEVHATLCATKTSAIACRFVPPHAASSLCAASPALGRIQTHNAGVGSSSLPPAIAQDVRRESVARLALFHVPACGTIDGTKPSEAAVCSSTLSVVLSAGVPPSIVQSFG